MRFLRTATFAIVIAAAFFYYTTHRGATFHQADWISHPQHADIIEAASGEDLVVIMYTSGTSAKPKGLAHKLGRMLRLDPETHRIVGDKDADALWSREYRPGWEPTV